MTDLGTILTALTNEKIAPPDVHISGAVIDSRQAVSGSLFIALPGEHVDGHDFVQAAFENGASLALVDQEMPEAMSIVDLRPGYFNPEKLSQPLPFCLRVENALTALQTIATFIRNAHPLRVIAITGSVGKTTTKELTASLLSQKYSVLKNPGNRNNEIGLPLTLLDLRPQHDCAVLEMGFYVPEEIQTLCNIAQPQVGVITNIGTVHAERAGTQEIIAKGKSELVQSLPPDGVAVLNLDDPWVRWMANKTQAKILSYGVQEPADLTASQIKSYGLEGITCTLTYAGEEHPVFSPLLGEISVYTILRATAVAITEGLPWDAIINGLEVSRVDLRMHQLTLPSGAIVLDDSYNASPESTIAALQFLKSLPGRRVAILGDMLELGPYEEEGHHAVGVFSTDAADVLIYVGERSKTAVQASLAQGFPGENLQWFPNAEAAAISTRSMVQNGDTVLIKGSNSMHMDQILKALEETP